MKKFTSLFLVLVLILFLIGCSNAFNKIPSDETTANASSNRSVMETSNDVRFNNFINNCYSFIDTGKFSAADGYSKKDHGPKYVHGGLSSNWINNTIKILNNHIISIPDYAKPVYYSIEMFDYPKKTDGYFQLSVLKSSKDDFNYIKKDIKFWLEFNKPIYVYTFSQVNYDLLQKEIDASISELSDEEKSTIKENIHLILYKC